MKLNIEFYLRDQALGEMRTAAEKYENRFGIRFTSLTYFSEEFLSVLHRAESGTEKIPEGVIIVSITDNSIVQDIAVLTEIANSFSISNTERKLYFETLKNVYRKLPSHPKEASQDARTLCVGIQREGKILGEAMGWLPVDRSICPDAKRIPYHKGLLVGLSGLTLLQQYYRTIIIDGAIASGATIISTIEKLRSHTTLFDIFSVHSTSEGLWAIYQYAQYVGVKVQITVGHTTKGLNSHYYAVSSTNEGIVVVGDLGDIIDVLVPDVTCLKK